MSIPYKEMIKNRSLDEWADDEEEDEPVFAGLAYLVVVLACGGLVVYGHFGGLDEHIEPLADCKLWYQDWSNNINEMYWFSDSGECCRYADADWTVQCEYMV